jgi:FtsH-binding integral membrane protein
LAFPLNESEKDGELGGRGVSSRGRANGVGVPAHTSMSTVNAERVAAATGPERKLSTVTVRGRHGILSRYFYFAMSLVLAAIVVAGFKRTVNDNLFHPAVARPFILWIHGSAFAGWVIFFICQTSLVRLHKVSWHRSMGWFGAGLATVMVPLGVTTAIIMARFDMVQLHQSESDAHAFLSIPFYDMIAFGVLVALAIYWRTRPELHRRLIFIATCGLMDAPVARFDYVFDHKLFFPFLDLLIVLGVGRDLLVDRRVHKVYRYALPVLIVGQSLAVYMWRDNPSWWQGITHAILG